MLFRSPSHDSTLVFSVSAEDLNSWRDARGRCLELLDGAGVRQSMYVGLESAGIVPLSIALFDLKSVRSLVLIDPETRPSPSFRDRVIGGIEEYLPLGLPFRGSTPGFDCKPFLQRVRCPVLLVGTPQASDYQVSQKAVFARELPTAWGVAIGNRQDVAEIVRLISEFQDVPAKCPQRRVSSVGGL